MWFLSKVVVLLALAHICEMYNDHNYELSVETETYTEFETETETVTEMNTEEKYGTSSKPEIKIETENEQYSANALKFTLRPQCENIEDFLPVTDCTTPVSLLSIMDRFRQFKLSDSTKKTTYFTCEKKYLESEPKPELGSGFSPEPEMSTEMEYGTTSEPEVKTETEPNNISAYYALTPLRPECGNIEYWFSNQTRKCYKFHAQIANTWDDAKLACEKEGAHLAIVNSYKEAQVLAALFEMYPAEKMTGVQYPDTAAIGYYKMGRFKKWQTIEGKTLEQAGYASWRPRAPHHFAKYGFICRDGLLYGYALSVRNIPFICEKKPF